MADDEIVCPWTLDKKLGGSSQAERFPGEFETQR
jgi:hypothetical protein